MDNISDNHNYQSPFDEIDLTSPLQLLAKWVDEAKELALPEPDAMNLATVDQDGNPHNLSLIHI